MFNESDASYVKSASLDDLYEELQYNKHDEEYADKIRERIRELESNNGAR